MADVLTEEALEPLRHAASANFYEVLRGLMVKQVASACAGEETPPCRYAEVTERDGGRYDSRHGFRDPLFVSLLHEGGAAQRLLPALRAVLGDDAEVVALGQVVALSREGWESTRACDDAAEFGEQAWHTDGRNGDLAGQTLTLFIPLCDLTASNGPTEFILGSHRGAAAGADPAPSHEVRCQRGTTILAKAGSAIAFDYRCLHRGLRNDSTGDRPMLYAIIGRPVWRDGAKGLPVLDCGSESLFGETPVVPTPSFPLGGGGHGSGEDVGGAGTEVQVGSADHSRSRRAQKRARARETA